MRNAFLALALCIPFEQLSNLEEQHHEYRLRKLGFSSRQKSYAKRTNGRDRHQKMLVEGISVNQPFNGLF